MDSTGDNERYLGRSLLRLSGADRLNWLQKLISQDISALGPEQPAAYSLLLTPQGKYLYDFFVIYTPHHLYIDVAHAQADALVEALGKYKLRSDIRFEPLPAMNIHLMAEAGEGLLCVRDPRAESLGYRVWRESPSEAYPDYGRTLTMLGLVEPSLELISGTSMPIEYALHTMHAISFTKGCYIGQELTARMQHKDLAKHRVIVAKSEDYQQIAGGLEPSVKDTNGVEIGTVIRSVSSYALLHVKRDHAGDSVLYVQRSSDGHAIQLARC